MPIVNVNFADNVTYADVIEKMDALEAAFNRSGYMCIAQTTGERIFASKKFMLSRDMWERFTITASKRPVNFSVDDPNNIFGQVKNMAAEKLRDASNKHEFLILSYDDLVSTSPVLAFEPDDDEKTIMTTVRAKISPLCYGSDGDVITDLKDCAPDEFWSKMCNTEASES